MRLNYIEALCRRAIDDNDNWPPVALQLLAIVQVAQ